MSGDDFPPGNCENVGVTEVPRSIDEAIDHHGLAPFLDAPAELYEVLSSPVRKSILIVLVEADDSLTVEQLAGRIVEYEGTEITNRSSALVRLHHVHLPKLRSCGVISVYNKSNNCIVELAL